jgi:hypothetical protein
MSTEHPRLVLVTGLEKACLLYHKDDLAYPNLFKSVRYGCYYADADELRAWRLQHTSEGQ